jgi:hypothetical protein
MNYSSSDNTGWNHAITIASWAAIFAWTKSRLQFSGSNFHIWTVGWVRDVSPPIFTVQNSHALA